MFKNKKIKSFFSTVICIVIASSSFYTKALDINVKEALETPFPQETHVTWYNLTKLLDIEKEETRLTMKIFVNNINYKMYLSFPQNGGFNLYSDSKGFFKASSYKKIKYTLQNDGILLNSDGDTSVLLRQKSNNWALDMKNKDKLVYRITGMQLSVGFDKDNNLAESRIEGTIGSTETFTGLGERYDSLIRNGTSALLWNIDAGGNVSTTDKSKMDSSYTNVPIIHSTNGYTIFFNSSYAIEADIGKTNSKKYTFKNYGNTMDFFFWTGKISNRMEGYMSLTGHNILPPKWSFSYWAGNSAVYWQRASGGDYLAELKKMIDGYQKIGTPVENMFVEGVIYRDNKVYSLLKKTGTRVIAWHDSAYYGRPNDALPGYDLFDLPIVKPRYHSTISDIGNRYYDFTNPLSAEAIDYRFNKYLKYGLKGAMIDFADAVPCDSVFYNGKYGDEMHNLYSYYYQSAFKELYEKYNGNDYILFARPGCAGSQSLMAKFLGDLPVSCYGIEEGIISGLSLSMSGFSTWGSDMGGLGMSTYSKPSEDTYRRWMQWSAFNPLMRSHGHTTRVPWDYSDGAVRDFQKYFWLRENLLNTIYDSAIKSNRGASVIASPLMLSFPEQPNLSRVGDEYMFCDNILVAPVYKEQAISKSVVLPNNNWTDFWTGKNNNGGTTINARASEGTIPLYLRSGAVIPVDVDDNLSLCSNMTDEKRNEGLLISPATGHRDIIFNNDINTAIKYSSDRNEAGNTTIKNISGSKAHIIIAKGISASSVSVDGELLENTDKLNINQNESYCVDHVTNTTTIMLPEKWSEFSIINGGGISKNLAQNAIITSNGDSSGNYCKNIIDLDTTNYYSLAKSGLTFNLDLGTVKKINELQLTWGLNYAKSYLIEASEDGVDWYTIKEVTDGKGDEEVIKLDKTYDAQYLRFSNFVNAQKSHAILADIRIYGDEMDYVGVCDITGKPINTKVVNITNDNEEDNFTDFIEGKNENTEIKNDTNSSKKQSKPSFLKKIIRRKLASDSSTMIIIIVIVSSSVIVIAGIVLFIILRRKRKIKNLTQ